MDTMLALETIGYAPPALGPVLGVEERDDVVWWAVAVGLAYTAALAWASWCKVTGGDPDISFGWSGFKVACKSRG